MALQLHVQENGRAQAAAHCANELWGIFLSQGAAAARARFPKLKNQCSRECGSWDVISNADVIRALNQMGTDKRVPELVRAIRKAATRAMSGVSVVAIMTAPAWCPGECNYCPTSAIAAKSYTGFEPAARRARANGFDSSRQVESRLRQFVDNGHTPSKCEVIVMGGTFNSLPLDYQRGFLKGAYDAFNGTPSQTLEEAISLNETAPSRVIGLVIETRPDWASPSQVNALLGWGTTRIELGVQSLDEAVLARTLRGHGVKESVDATRTCKDLFLKVGYHVMLGIYSTPQKERAELPRVFSDPDLRPDMLKIYPALVIPGTPLHQEWQAGEHVPYTNEEVVDVICEIKRSCPPYARIMRIDRDIPTPQIAAGVKETNLREIVQRGMEDRGLKCRCIRCREAGIAAWKQGRALEWGDLEMQVMEYEASGAREAFISFELPSEDLLAGFVRLRGPSGREPLNPAVTPATAGIRELRVFGEQVEVGKALDGAIQHQHLGRRLMDCATELAGGKWGAQKLVVTSGVGVRPYYAKLGFVRDGPYMSKNL